MITRILLALGLWWIGTLPVAAHVANLSAMRLSIEGEAVTGDLNVNPADIAAALAPRGGTAALDRYLADQIQILDGAGRICPQHTATIQEGDHTRITLAWRCPGTPMAYRSHIFQELDQSARHLVTLGAHQAMLDQDRPSLPLGNPPSWAAVARDYVLTGVEHIFLGYDHIAFLLAVILWARQWRAVLAIVTGFTLAHSVTLGLAAFDIVALPEVIVEPLVAASIIVVALENYLIRSTDHRWWMASLFGLIHGFAFAGVLGEMGLPEHARFLALISFNLGVEAGQILLVALTVPLLIWAERRISLPAVRGFVYAASALLALMGLYWLLERLPWA